MKEDPTVGLIVVDHKQTISQMKYREVQVEYFGKIGMSMLGTMLVQWKLRSSIHLREKKYLKVLVYIYKLCIQGLFQARPCTGCFRNQGPCKKRLKNIFLKYKKNVFQSDNASCFVSQELIPDK